MMLVPAHTFLLIFCFTSYASSVLNAPKLTLPIQQGLVYTKKNEKMDIRQYFISEKLDGMRGYWNGKQLLSRQGNLINSPKWFTKNWPKTSIEGELWISRNNFQALISCVRRHIAGKCWNKIHFMMFDLPKHSGQFLERVKQMHIIATQVNTSHLKVIAQSKVSSLRELERRLNQVIFNEGEGLMLHLTSAYYHIGRTSNLLKLKKHQDAEAVVIEHFAGKGKYKHMLGALSVRTSEGIIFKIGSGFTDKDRISPPAIGQIITYKYNGLTQSGIPKFARYWRIKTKLVQEKTQGAKNNNSHN